MAAGVQPAVSPLLTPPGGVQAQLEAGFAKRVGLPPHCPVLSVGDALGGLAAGVGAHARRWLVSLDDGLSAAWVGPAPKPAEGRWWMPQAPSTVTLQVLDGGQVEEVEPPRDPRWPGEATQLEALLGEGFDWLPGPGPQHATFAAHAAQGVARGPLWRRALGADIEGVAPGGEGLRVLPGRTTAAVIGARAGHNDAALGCALVEGCAFEVYRWAGVAFEDAPAQPIRLALGDGWPLGAAQRFADILEGPVLAYDADQAARARLVGVGVSAWRGLGVFVEAEVPPSLTATHGAQAALYGPHRALHAALMEASQPLLR
jgi:hypothetical protein